MTEDEKVEKLRKVAKELGVRMKTEEFPDGKGRAWVEVRIGEESRTSEKIAEHQLYK